MSQDTVQVITAPGDISLVPPFRETFFKKTPVILDKFPEIPGTFTVELHGQNVVQTVFDHAFQNTGKILIATYTFEFFYQKIHRPDGQPVVGFPVLVGIAILYQ